MVAILVRCNKATVYFRDGLLAALCAMFVSCGGSSNASVGNTGDNANFSTYPKGYFTGNYSATYLLSGTSVTGEIFSGVMMVQSGDTVQHRSEKAATINTNIEIKNTANGSVAYRKESHSYISDNANDIVQFIGGNLLDTGLRKSYELLKPMPQTLRVGDFGDLGAATLSDGTSESITWSLESASGGKARLVFTSVYRDSSERLDYTEVISWLITSNGYRQSLEIYTTNHQSNTQAPSLSGVRK